MRDLVSENLPSRLSEPFSLIEQAFRRLTGILKNMEPAQLEYAGPESNLNSTAACRR